MMSEPVEWDFPPTKRHRGPRVEYLPPSAQCERLNALRPPRDGFENGR